MRRRKGKMGASLGTRPIKYKKNVVLMCHGLLEMLTTHELSSQVTTFCVICRKL